MNVEREKPRPLNTALQSPVRHRALLQSTVRPAPPRESKPVERVIQTACKAAAAALILLSTFLLQPSTLLADTVVGNVVNSGLSPTPTNITFTPIFTPSVNGNSVIWTSPHTATSDTNGDFSIVLTRGLYRVQVAANPKDSFIILTKTNISTVTNQLVSLITNSIAFSTSVPSYVLRSVFTTRGDIVVYDGTNVSRLGAGSQSQVLVVNTNSATGLSYTNAGAGTVTSVGVSSTWLTVGGSPITASGTITLTVPYTPQAGSANLTNWSGVSTGLFATLGQLNLKQTASANLDMWSGVSTGLFATLGEFNSYTNGANLHFQLGSLNLTNWSGVGTNLFTTLGQFNAYTNGADLRFQLGSANLTNWSGVSTGLFATLGQLNLKQTASANLDMWSGVSTGLFTTLGEFNSYTNGANLHFQLGSANLTNWSGVSTGLFATLGQLNLKQTASANLDMWSGVSTQLFTTLGEFNAYTNGVNLNLQRGSANLTNYSGAPTNTWVSQFMRDQNTNQTWANPLVINCASNAARKITVRVAGSFALHFTNLPTDTNAALEFSLRFIGTNASVFITNHATATNVFGGIFTNAETITNNQSLMMGFIVYGDASNTNHYTNVFRYSGRQGAP